MPGASEIVSNAPMGEELVAAAMAGDGEAIGALWELHRRWIAAVLLAHKPAFEDLEDLLQEVAVTFVSKVNTLRDETSLRAWLRTIALNAARAAGRSGKYRPRPHLPPEDRLPSCGSVDHRLADDEHVRQMLRRLARLPEAYREPLLLRAVKGLRSKQIAELLDIPPATVDTRIARARRMLRQADERVPEPSSTDEAPAADLPIAPFSANATARPGKP